MLMEINLSPIAKQIFDYLRKHEKVKVLDMAKDLNLDQSLVMRNILEMKAQGIIETWEQDEVIFTLTREGEKALAEGLPEEQLINFLKSRGEVHINDINIKDKQIAIAWAKSKGAITINKGIVKLINEKINVEEKDLLRNVKEKKTIEEKDVVRLKKRKFLEIIAKTYVYARIRPELRGIEIKMEEEVTELTPEIIKNWKDKKFKKFDIYSPAKQVYSGKQHPVNQVIECVRKIWLDMGFKEMTGSKVVQGFWNFDALFTPQDHPAREMQDTFYLNYNLQQINANKQIIQRVKEMHENGDEKSDGWGYEWKESYASKLLLRTHTTVLSALQLASLKPKDLPAKYFAISKVFRNETLDWKHLFEFYQVEGFVASNDVNFKHLLGYLKVFFKKMGYDKIRVRPAYFPYTELSLEIEIFMPEKGWVELAGAGMFRPEVVKPLFGDEIKVLAWGLGLERIIMNYYELQDIRDVYTTDINKLRELKRWLY